MSTSNRGSHVRPGVRASNERGGKLHTVTTDHDAEQAFRKLAADFGTLPGRICDLINIDENGEPRPGGISPAGRRLAADLPNLLRTAERAAAEMLGRRAKPMTDDKVPDETTKPAADVPPHGHDHTGVFRVSEEAARDLFATLTGERTSAKSAAAKALAGWPALAVALGLGGPIRAALRAGAQALAVALDDGATDDTGSEYGDGRTGFLRDRIVPDGTDQHDTQGALVVTLGREPFVLVRALPVADGVSLSVAMGGDGLSPEVGEHLHAEVMLGNALDGITQARRTAASLGDRLNDYLKYGTYLVPPGGEYRWTDTAWSGFAHSTEDPHGGRSRPPADDVPVPVDTPAESPAPGPPSGDDGRESPDSGSSVSGDTGPASD